MRTCFQEYFCALHLLAHSHLYLQYLNQLLSLQFNLYVLWFLISNTMPHEIIYLFLNTSMNSSKFAYTPNKETFIVLPKASCNTHSFLQCIIFQLALPLLKFTLVLHFQLSNYFRLHSQLALLFHEFINRVMKQRLPFWEHRKSY